jgi:predicted ATP-grasp superfamily ATP-dependent carboligase
LQQFIPGRAFGLVAIANGKTTQLLGMTRSLRQRFGAHAFVYSGSFGPVWDPHIPVRAMIELARRVAAEYSIVGLFNLDFIRDRSNRWWLLELNARPSGSCEIIERAAWRSGKLPPNRSLMQLDIEVPEGMIPLWGEDDCTVQYLKQIVYARREGMFAGWAESGSLADIPAPGTKIQKGHPIATFVNEFAIGNSPLWRQIRGNSRRLNQALRCVNV